MNSYLHSFSYHNDSAQKSSRSHIVELSHLPLDTRNKIRALSSAKPETVEKAIENFRSNLPYQQLFKVERILRLKGINGKCILPSLFPTTPQIQENYTRLKNLNLELQLKLINSFCKEYKYELEILVAEIYKLSNLLLKMDLAAIDEQVHSIINDFGYSHILMRKAALAYINNSIEKDLPNIEKLFNLAKLGDNNIITSTLVQSYQEDQDFLSIKRSVLSIEDRGEYNKFTRDMLRTTFHCHAISSDEANDFIQSNLQSSLIDALISIKINAAFIPELQLYEEIVHIIEKIENSHPGIESIAEYYVAKESGNHDPEHIFYQQSSAWLESSEIIGYRFLLDNFYDEPLAQYIIKDPATLDKINLSTSVKDLESLSENTLFHSCEHVNKLQNAGTITRTSLFNFILSITSGHCQVSEDALFNLMHKTSELDKTTQVEHLKNLSKHNISDESSIIINLLISKRSKDELDKFKLRRKLQEIVAKRFNKNLIEYIKHINCRSENVANYMYELFTEDFISRLSKLITETSIITETRAGLHEWMGVKTGDKSYTDRARTLLIDHQINKIRNEIDDHRIYVDMSRFYEWVNDELVRDISSILTSLSHKKTLNAASTDIQLLNLIEKAFYTFCSNNIFGIASYLGRRIRHGTFRGHLYTSVTQIESEYKVFFSQYPVLQNKWIDWKHDYENKINNIMIEMLHIESTSKRLGFLKPNIRNPTKLEIAASCAQTLANDFEVNSNRTISITNIISEYCWRIAEVDLREFNKFLKKNKFNIQDFIQDFKAAAFIESPRSVSTAIEFTRDLQQLFSKKIDTMIGWFKRPTSVSPKASVQLLYKAVVEEVKESFPGLIADTKYSDEQDIELMGGAYHLIYDALYVVIYNAAKHGLAGAQVLKDVYILSNGQAQKTLKIHIKSQVSAGCSDKSINDKLAVNPDDDITNAQLSESRSGIRKLYNLQQTDTCFTMEKYRCSNGVVESILCYKLV